MSDGQLLLLVFALIYLSDCFIWVNKKTSVFIGNIFGKWHVHLANPLLGSDSGGIASLNFFPPTGRVFSVPIIPVSISPSLIVSYNSQTLKAAIPTAVRIQQYSFEQIEDVGIDGKEVSINSKVFCKCGNFIQAKNLSQLIKKLKGEAIEKRENLIRKFLEESYEFEKANQIYLQVKEQVDIVTMFSDILFFVLFLVFPVETFLFGVNWAFIMIAIIMFILAIITAVIFYRGHSKLFPKQKSDRVIEVIKMVFCPPVAIRSADQLSVCALSEFSPLVVANIFLSSEKFKDFAGEFYRCLKYPTIDKNLEKIINESLEWQNNVSLEIMESFFKSIKFEAIPFLAPPIPEDQKTTVFCPRCLNQFHDSLEECPDCEGVKTMIFKR